MQVEVYASDYESLMSSRYAILLDQLPAQSCSSLQFSMWNQHCGYCMRFSSMFQSSLSGSIGLLLGHFEKKAITSTHWNFLIKFLKRNNKITTNQIYLAV